MRFAGICRTNAYPAYAELRPIQYMPNYGLSGVSTQIKTHNFRIHYKGFRPYDNTITRKNEKTENA